MARQPGSGRVLGTCARSAAATASSCPARAWKRAMMTSSIAVLRGAGRKRSAEGGDAGLGAAEDEGVDVVRALVGVGRLEVHDMADDVELVDDAVAAVHVARDPGDVEGLAAGVALHDRRDLGRVLALVLEAPQTQASLQPERDLGLHVGELLLDQLVRGQRPPELLPVERVLARRVPAEFRGAQGTPGDAVARVVEATERPLEAFDAGQMVLFGDEN